MQDVNVPQMPQADEQIFTSESFTWIVVANGEAETSRLARHLASFVRPGDLITLSGGLGVGKTSFARGLIRAVLREPAVEVPSPTFTLMQVYEGENFPVIHADLFRLQSRAELEALGWEEMSENALVLVEWPERAGVDTAARDGLAGHGEHRGGGAAAGPAAAAGQVRDGGPVQARCVRDGAVGASVLAQLADVRAGRARVRRAGLARDGTGRGVDAHLQFTASAW